MVGTMRDIILWRLLGIDLFRRRAATLLLGEVNNATYLLDRH
jgi:hypothetical protein